MADAVSCVTKAVELALKIKDAVDTVRQNRKDCAHIKRRVERVRHTLSLCEGNAELMESPAVRDAVEALAEVLGEALELVAGCQEETSAVCLYCTAGKLSKQLGKVDRGISDGSSEATFAILVYHISKQSRDAAPPAMPTEPGEITEPLAAEEVPEQAQENVFSPEQKQHDFFKVIIVSGSHDGSCKISDAGTEAARFGKLQDLGILTCSFRGLKLDVLDTDAMVSILSQFFCNLFD